MKVSTFRKALLGAAALDLAALAPAFADDKAISIDFVSGPLSDSFFPPLYQGAQDAAKALGVKLNYISIDEADIEATSAHTMQTAIAQKPDAIVVGDFVTSVVDPYIKQAVAAGIPVYVDQSGQDQWQGDGAFGFVGQQGPEVGNVAVDRLARAGSKNILCVINVPRNPYLQAICKGLAEKGKKLSVATSNLELPTAADLGRGETAWRGRLAA
jgi:simple sugar transport system substrate-binding protein